MKIISSFFLLVIILSSFITNAYSNAETINFERLQSLATKFSEKIIKEYEISLAPLKSPPLTCQELNKSYQYINALIIKDNYNECIKLVDLCITQHNNQIEGLDRIIMLGAHCSKKKFQYDIAYKYYDLATNPGFSSSQYFLANLYRFAHFAEFTQYGEQTKSILEREKKWLGFSIDIVYASMNFFSMGISKSPEELQEILNFEKKVLKSSNAELKKIFYADRVWYLYNIKFHNIKALELIEENLNKFSKTSSWQNIAFKAIYKLSPQDDFSAARKVYDAYEKYVSSDYALPTEDNVFNYTQLYNDICKETLSQGEVHTKFKNIFNRWQQGELPLDSALQELENLNDEVPNKADVLTTIGTLYVMKENDELAHQFYWMAHKQCRYYNRSHRGLSNIRRRKRNKAFHDYQKLYEKYISTVETLHFSDELPLYVLNWNSLTEEGQQRVKFSLRYWEGLIDDIYNTRRYYYRGRFYPVENRLYIKPSCQLMSECPNKADQRDTRTSYDNRLRDDIRGQGGETVISEYDETIENPWGAYNLAGHEVAHQAHYSFPRPIQECIKKLYDNALEHDTFPEAYAKMNEYEYFAQGVTYFMIPADSPARFGINISWYTDNDPKLLELLESIRNSTSFAEITCPI